jgi:hypothetical protein
VDQSCSAKWLINFPNRRKQAKVYAYVFTFMLNEKEKVIEEAFRTYLKAKMTAMDNKIPLAPALLSTVYD